MSNLVESEPPRPRNRRQVSRTYGTSSSSRASLLDLSPTPSEHASRSQSPLPPVTRGSTGGRGSRSAFAGFDRKNSVNDAINRASGLIDVGWSNFAGFASSIIGDQGGLTSGNRRPTPATAKPNFSGGAFSTFHTRSNDPEARNAKETRPASRDIAAGAIAEREAKVLALKTASILESHEGVNGGLDVAGRFKRRNSDENLGSHTHHVAQTAELLRDKDCLVYIHQISATDTYPGLVLRYRCHDDAIKKANGLFNTSHIHIRRHVLVPVDASEVKGRPCEPPSFANAGKVDLLAATPNAEESSLEGPTQARGVGEVDYFGLVKDVGSESKIGDDKPWEHVRWVRIDGFMSPVEIGRVPRKHLGYYPPRRKKDTLSPSTSKLTTPRQSVDLQSTTRAGPTSRPSIDAVSSFGSPKSRRRGDSITSSSRNMISSGHGRTRSRMSSISILDDPYPPWLRGPGGIGTLDSKVRAPGPQPDPLNKWARKHFAKLAVDDLPSMSVIGSETAHFGFSKDEAVEIAQGGDGTKFAEVVPAEGGGNNFDKMTIGIESWLRGAWQNRASVGPAMLGPSRRCDEGDLIELEVTSDDGRIGSSPAAQNRAPYIPGVDSRWGSRAFVSSLSGGMGGANDVGASGRSSGGSTSMRGNAKSIGSGKDRNFD